MAPFAPPWLRLCPSTAHNSCDGHVGYIFGRREQVLAKFLVCPLDIFCIRRWQSLNVFTCKKAKALPISLAKVPTLHRIAVGRNLESWCRYEGGPMLWRRELSYNTSVRQSAVMAETREGQVRVGVDIPSVIGETGCFLWVIQGCWMFPKSPGSPVKVCFVVTPTPVDMLAVEVTNGTSGWPLMWVASVKICRR